VSVFSKLVSIVIVAVAIRYFFDSVIFLPFVQNHTSTNQDKVVTYAIKEPTYEMTDVDKNIDFDMFVDNAVKETLRTD